MSSDHGSAATDSATRSDERRRPVFYIFRKVAVRFRDLRSLHLPNPADLSDDPVDTAARLVVQMREKIEAGEDNDPADYL